MAIRARGPLEMLRHWIETPIFRCEIRAFRETPLRQTSRFSESKVPGSEDRDPHKKRGAPTGAIFQRRRVSGNVRHTNILRQLEQGAFSQLQITRLFALLTCRSAVSSPQASSNCSAFRNNSPFNSAMSSMRIATRNRRETSTPMPTPII